MGEKRGRRFGAGGEWWGTATSDANRAFCYQRYTAKTCECQFEADADLGRQRGAAICVSAAEACPVTDLAASTSHGRCANG